jgi:hypothetical protein
LGTFKKNTITVELGDIGYPGEKVEVWSNFPMLVLKDLMKTTGDDTPQFLIENKLIVRSSFQGVNGLEMPFEELPWDVQARVSNMFVKELSKIQARVLGPSTEGPKTETAEG